MRAAGRGGVRTGLRWRAVFVGVALALALAACGGTEELERPPDLSLPTLEISTADGPVAIHVEIADAPEEWEAGLMGRPSLPRRNGMAFLYPSPVEDPFWMKDTLIPLSVAFWDARMRIVAIVDMAPCRAAPCPTYDAGVPYVGAVEVNRGFFARHGVALGDHVRLEPAP